MNPEERFERLHKLRKKAKVVNYSSLYGVGAPKLAREMGVTRKEAQELLDAFWKLNWAIRKVAEQQFTKEVGGYTWVKNSVSGFWHELRYSKDTWSTINQSTGVYIFDSWLARARLYGYMGQGQFHDETLASVPNESQTREQLKHAIAKLNTDLKLNVAFAIDVKSGANYKDVH
jgi:DNA polymerase I-like protein with 3'-5' exonuclease and polymerase domains